MARQLEEAAMVAVYFASARGDRSLGNEERRIAWRRG